MKFSTIRRASQLWGSMAVAAALIAPTAWAQPTAELVVTDDGEPRILVERDAVDPGGRTMFELKNNGNINFTMDNQDKNATWTFAARNTVFVITKNGVGEPPLLQVRSNGDLVLRGDVKKPSSRAIKEAFEPINGSDVLEKMVSLEISKWQYTEDDLETRHVGPMAEDFHAAFGLGDDSTIGTGDAQGLLIAAVQGLHGMVEAKDEEIARLKEQNESFAVRLAAIEANLSEK